MVMLKLDLRDGETIPVLTWQSWSPDKEPCLQALPRMKHPATLVRIIWTAGPSCTKSSECVKELQRVQAEHRAEGFKDITHNFLIGGDGIVYQARGWFVQTALSPGFKEFSDRCVDIAYIGNFDKEDPPYSMVEKAMNLIAFGLKQGFINPCFKIVPYERRIGLLP